MRVGQAGGYSAAFTTMQSLGLMPMKAIAAQPIAAAAGTGKGVKIVVLGGGVGGLVTAYEAKMGYEVTLLEARHGRGGRAWSAQRRYGGVVDGTRRRSSGQGLYQNMGPARLLFGPRNDAGILSRLKVPLEVKSTRAADASADDKAGGGRRYSSARRSTTRGQVSELLSKAIAGGKLDQERHRRSAR